MALLQIDFQEKLDDVEVVDVAVGLAVHEALDGLQVFFGAEALLEEVGAVVRLLIILHDEDGGDEVAPRLAELVEGEAVLTALLLDHLGAALKESQHGAELVEHRLAEAEHLEEFFDTLASGVPKFVSERLLVLQQDQEALQPLIDFQEDGVGVVPLQLLALRFPLRPRKIRRQALDQLQRQLSGFFL